MRKEKEIKDMLNKVDEEVQKIVIAHDEGTPDILFRELWLLRTCLLWAKGDLDDIR